MFLLMEVLAQYVRSLHLSKQRKTSGYNRMNRIPGWRMEEVLAAFIARRIINKSSCIYVHRHTHTFNSNLISLLRIAPSTDLIEKLLSKCGLLRKSINFFPVDSFLMWISLDLSFAISSSHQVARATIANHSYRCSIFREGQLLTSLR